MGLARLIAAGLPVPPGFVLDDAAFRAIAGELEILDEDAIGHTLAEAQLRLCNAELPAALVREVEERAAPLGTLAVRSSATIEDGEAGAAAGVFSSRTEIPAADVWAAIRAVWTSALTPLAAAYGRRRGGTIAIGVIVQAFVPGERVTVYTRAPGAPEGARALIQRGGELALVPRSSSDPALVLALRAEAAIGATGGADVELVGDVIVQARPVIHPVIHPHLPVPPLILAPLVADGRHWRWDVAHNPDPLSLAQIGLVERIERAELGPYAMRVCGGYLYTAPRGEPPVVTPPRSGAALDARAREIEARIGASLGLDIDPLVGRLDPLAITSRGEPPPLEEALARYLAFYELFGAELGPLIAAARSTLTAAQLAGARPSAVEQTLLAAARTEIDESSAAERLGMLAPAWDVAVPTYGERRGILPAAIRRARTIARALVAPSPPDERDDLARAAADLAERDDHWFARAQLLVRRAILARAATLGLDPDDACWIPLDELLEGNALDPDDVRRRASAARNAAARAGRWRMPRSVGGPPEAPVRALHGVGTGPRITGRIVRYPTLAAAISASAGDVVVTRAVTPALAVQVIGCAALVSETGGLLDHGAALARELGITCVVGCHDAWSLLADGMVVTVDGDAGSVEISS